MRKEILNSGNDTKWDPSRLPRSMTSSRSSGRTVTPLPQIQVAPSKPTLPGIATTLPCKAGKPGLSMQEVHHLAQLKEQHLQRSNLHCNNSSNLHVAQTGIARVRSKNVHGKRKKKDEMAEMQETEKKMAEVAQSRAAFNRKNGSLPSIGQTELGITHTTEKLPKIAEPGVGNQVIDIINKHEPDVIVRAIQKEVSGDFLKNAAKNLPAVHANTAPEIILQNEAKVGKAYKGLSYDEFYSKMFEDERSRSMSRASRGSAASWEKEYFC